MVNQRLIGKVKEKEDHSVGYVFKIEKEETPTEW